MKSPLGWWKDVKSNKEYYLIAFLFDTLFLL